MQWITRERVRTDRVASAWLIKRMVDPDAQFLFVPRERVMIEAQQAQATPFHVPEAELGQHGDRIGFDAIVARYGISDQAILLLADLVRAADQWGNAPEAAGLNAIMQGFFLMRLTDEKALELEFPIFDALYRYCQDRLKKDLPANPTA